jgi:hypothetical protein
MRRADAELIIYLVLILFVIFVLIPLNYTNGQDRVIHIKSVTNVTGEHTTYKVFTKEGVFSNADRWLIGKFNSSDLQNEMMGKKECKVHTMGYRIPFLSSYPNITKIYWCK